MVVVTAELGTEYMNDQLTMSINDRTYEADDPEGDEAADDPRVLEVDVVEGGGAVPDQRVAHADEVGDVLFVLWIGCDGDGVRGVAATDLVHGAILLRLCRRRAVAEDGDAGRAVVEMPASKKVHEDDDFGRALSWSYAYQAPP